MTAGRQRGAAPVAALVAVLALPALALFGLWRFADGRTASTRRLDAAHHAGPAHHRRPGRGAHDAAAVVPARCPA